MKPNIKFQIATIGINKQPAYVIIVNDGWYTAAHILYGPQRMCLNKSAHLRARLKQQLTSSFWRFIGAA